MGSTSESTGWLTAFLFLFWLRSLIWRSGWSRLRFLQSSFMGGPRLTQDVHALAILPDNKWESAGAQHFGIVPRIEQASEGARRSTAQAHAIRHFDRRDTRRTAL